MHTNRKRAGQALVGSLLAGTATLAALLLATPVLAPPVLATPVLATPVLATPVLAAAGDPGEPEPISFALQFGAVVGDAPFACGARYEVGGVGMEARDLRFYVSDVRLVRNDGTEVPLELEQDGLWQHQGVALLDFEDASGGCRNGTAQTRDVVSGMAPAGDYRGLRFTMGVPMELNHINQATAPSPLSLTALFWSWNAGYKFLRAEVLSDGLPQGFFVHLGSTLCTPEGRVTQPATDCRNGNRVTVDIPDFDPSSDRVVFDLARLLDGTALAGDGEATRGACMSAPQDTRCGPIFSSLGLPFGEKGGATQQVFRVDRGYSTTAAGARQ